MKKLAVLFMLLATTTVLVSQDRPAAQLKRGNITVVEGLRALQFDAKGPKQAGDGFIFRYNNDQFIRYASFDGKTTYQYNTRSIPSKYIYGGLLNNFTSDGQYVYVLTGNFADPKKAPSTPNNFKIFVSRYDMKGTYLSTVPLDGTYNVCNQFAVVGSSKDMLVVSCTVVEKNKTEFNDPVRGYDPVARVGLFQTNGQFVRWLELPNDISIDPTVVSLKDKTKWAPAGNKPKHNLDALEQQEFEQMVLSCPIERDSQGNVMVSRFVDPQGYSTKKLPTPTVFLIGPDLSVRRVELQTATAKFSGLSQVNLIGGKIVALFTETKDASQRAYFVLRVFDLKGKMIGEYAYEPFDFGLALVDWNPHRALFLTQTGDPINPMLGLLEGVE